MFLIIIYFQNVRWICRSCPLHLVKSNATIDRSRDANKYSDVTAKLCTGLFSFETKNTFCN